MVYRKNNHGPKLPKLTAADLERSRAAAADFMDPVKHPERFLRAEANAVLRYARHRQRLWARGLAEVLDIPKDNPLAGVFTVSEAERVTPVIYKIMEDEWQAFGTEDLLTEYASYDDWLREQTEIINFLRSGARPDDGVLSEPLKELHKFVRPPEKPVPPRVVEFAGAMAQEITAALRDDLKAITARCESPLEQLMLLALARGGAFRPGLVVIQQPDILSYRADFLIGALSAPGAAPHWAVVECDGHEFHERTAEQAEHDRARDRAMTAAGYRVFRFTGREIWRDPKKCADEVMTYLRPFTGADYA